MPYILALDQGTTSSRALLFDRGGRVAVAAQHEFPQLCPRAGWVEHDPGAILNSQLAAATDALRQAGAGPRDVLALGIANQRETTLVWNRASGEPVCNALVWQDRRGADLCQRLEAAGAGDLVRRKTGLRLDPYFSATKLAWILDNIPGVRAQAERGELAFGTVDTWLIWRLTGGRFHATDRTNASRTLLYNIVEDRWDPELLDLFHIPPSLLPEVTWSSQTLGPVTDVTGLAGIEIAGVAGDQQAALFGQLCIQAGEAKTTYGTGCFLLRHLGDRFTPSEHRLITTLACSPRQKLEYALEGSVFIGGAVVQWLRDNLKLFAASADIEALAATVDSSDGVVFVPAFTGLGAPHWDPHATGLIVGLHRGTQIPHLARAALESIAFQVADVLEAMDQDTSQPLTELCVDGGAAANNMLMQFQADLLQRLVRRPANLETTALGAAYLAGLAVNFWSSTDEIARLRPPDTLFQPRAGREAMVWRRVAWREAVRRATGWNRPQ